MFRREMGVVFSMACILAAGNGCAQKPVGRSVSEAAASQHLDAPAPAVPEDTGNTAPSPAIGAQAPAASDDAIAVVDGQPISRAHLIDLLLAGHGVGILEQLVVFERAKKIAADEGILVTAKDVDAEMERTLRNLLSPLEAADENEPFDHDEAERLLNEVLARRNVSRAEFLEVVKRNAYLRAIAAAHIKPTNAQIEAEYRRSYGKRAEIRHIQAPTFAEAKKAAELVKVGADFAQVARESSTNLRTAPGGGLLPPFSREDESVPKPLREAAFSLKEDEVSAPIRVDDWYHVVRLERFIAADQTPLAQIRPEVEHRLRLRMIEPTVQQLYRSLFEQADIKINDPTLEREFERKHPKPRRTTR